MLYVSLALFLLAGCSRDPATSTPIPPTPEFILLGEGEINADEPGIETTYICNEGFLIVSSDKKILVDALFEGHPDYGTIPPERRALMEKALPPFDEVDLVLVTHDHSDHFEWNVARKHLENNPQAILVSTEEATTELRELFPDRVKAVNLEEGERAQFTLNEIELEAVGLVHTVPHVGFIFTVDGKRFLHIGDGRRFIPQSSEERFDLAFVHVGARVSQAEHTITMHWAPGYYADMQKWILQ